MLYSNFIFIRLLIGNVLIRPWEFLRKNCNVNDTEENRIQVKIMCSILYYMILEYMEEKCPIMEDKFDNILDEYRPIPI